MEFLEEEGINELKPLSAEEIKQIALTITRGILQKHTCSICKGKGHYENQCGTLFNLDDAFEFNKFKEVRAFWIERKRKKQLEYQEALKIKLGVRKKRFRDNSNFYMQETQSQNPPNFSSHSSENSKE